ncbi:uncharacterized protein LOC123217220 [Mangifera indica]|uniref:uncharacterized protein LOC123217220 n=1 Tax=Mangifera indica TaxID=29780 RepID=UPI001CF96600|nr:uncharacterized protein LOC123217220 [Mangifera indica]
MASMASPSSCFFYKKHNKGYNGSALPRISLCQSQPPDNKSTTDQNSRRAIILRSSELAVVGAIFNFSGKKPEYLGVQKNQATLALCPATKNCISTAENVSDLIHYVPPWNYNRGRKNAVTKEVAMEELLQVVESTKADRFTPRIVEKKDDYVHVEYESPILGLVDDVEFWFPPGKESIVEYRAASRLGNFDFDYNRKRIKALRLELEKKGWAPEDTF